MPRLSNPELIEYARKLRKNMTKEERHLWYDFLKNYPVRFSRQKIIGIYIADFYCPEVKLVIELDGSQHYGKNHMQKDEERTEFFKLYGIQVIRIPNNQVNQNFAGVCAYIDNIVQKSLSLADARQLP